ncbi:hypothetical protein T492DRAFT_1123450 [Pavlovales sp. CCMP2436]|nr:hypothetical protein T492DRAFT_1123450 [Pavlovales sp. CCMP2436]
MEASASLVRLPTGEIALRMSDEVATLPDEAAPAATAAAAAAATPRRRQRKKGRPRVPPPPYPTCTDDELDGFERHVWHGCFICVIYLPRNMDRCTETIANIVAHGFPAPFMIPGVTPRSPSDTVHDCVCRAHHNAVSWFLSKGLDSRYHMLVFEDDARFVYDDAPARLTAGLDTLEAWGKWGSLHVGHIPMGPIYPLANGLVRSVNPATSHCYVLNRRSVRSIHAMVPERLWKRPMMVEGHWAYPADERFAMTPPLATQCVMPKEMASMPIIRDYFTFQDGEVVLVIIGYTLTLVAAGALVLLVVLAFKWPLRQLAAAQLEADGDNTPPCKQLGTELSATLAAWLTVSALLLHTCYYAARRFTCALAERRHWRTYGLDAARTGFGLVVAGALEFGYVTRVGPSKQTLEQVDCTLQ